MIPGVRGRLVTASFARDVLPGLPGAEAIPPAAARSLRGWWHRCDASLGPASAVRSVADVALVPLLRLLGFEPVEGRHIREHQILEIHCGGGVDLAAVATVWNASLDRAWRMAVMHAIARDAAWCFCCNGTALRIVDARRTWAREYLEFDLQIVAEEHTAQSFLWSVARGTAMAQRPSLMERAVLLSAQHGAVVCAALGRGVLDALQFLVEAMAQRQRGRYAPDLLFEHALTVLYRVLFLLFAEARSLVPIWHPIYRDRYSLDHIVSVVLSGRCYRGLWHALQAISRLAHTGCTAADLTVTAFNGRLFSPAAAVAFDRTRLGDEVMSRAVVAVSTTPSAKGARHRIAFRDLDVEQLGAVYEQVLDYEPASGTSPETGIGPLARTGDKRKATGTFYTPRPVTAWLVRHILDPLVGGRSADDILQLRILDPAMGSGAFLVAACRYLAGALEEALVREGGWHAHDVSDSDRADLRRTVASHCLFGVDANPVAVQLARLSLWLATLAAGKPLSFLDHHLIAGDSLVGATPDDVRRQPGGGGARRGRPAALPLLDDNDLRSTLSEGARRRLQILATADDSVAVVRAKEHVLAALQHRDGALRRWTRMLDLWCAAWFWDDGQPPDRRLFAALADQLLHDRGPLAAHAAAPLLAHADALAGRHRFLHWPLAFPEVFVDSDGRPSQRAGFDAVIGNPPWDMVRGDSGDPETRGRRRAEAQRLSDFVRGSGIYRVETRAHANRYQLFVERALQLVREGGRVGLVLPSGVATDTGAAPLRRHLFDRAAVDEIVGFDNRDAIFPIHRSVRFLLLTCTAGEPTNEMRCRFHVTQPQELERVDGRERSVTLSRRFLGSVSGEDDLGIPEVTGSTDLRILERISHDVPRLGAKHGWNVRFGRELNASDDRDAFSAYTGAPSARPVVEGKQVEPFRVAVGGSRLQLADGHDQRVPRRARLAYRDVASATNRLTLIAAVMPPRAVTTHTLFCLKTSMPTPSQHVLCALLNSYVANYLVRLRVTTHVTVALVSRLPVPLVQPGEPAFERLLALSTAIAHGTTPAQAMDEYAELQAVVARLYRLSIDEFAHVLGTFPLVPAEVKAAAHRWFQGRLSALAPRGAVAHNDGRHS
jgi:hypothetical protein